MHRKKLPSVQRIPAPHLPCGYRTVAIDHGYETHEPPPITPEYLAQLNARWNFLRAEGIVERALLLAGEKL